MGGLGLLSGLTWFFFLLLPTATYILLFPLLGALLGVGLVLWQSRHESTGSAWTTKSWSTAGWLLAGALPTLFMLAPLIQQVAVIIDLQLPLAPVVLLGLALLLLLPLWLLIEPGLRWRNLPALPISLFLLSVGVMGMAGSSPVPAIP